MAIRRIAPATNGRPYPVYEVSQIHDLTRFVTSHSYEGYAAIFRGQRRNWSLLPKVARLELDPEDSLLDVEEHMFQEFRRMAVSYAEFPEDSWETLAVAQHHGLPTRLLDWTYNPLAAVWFCVSEPTRPKSGVGVVWMHIPDADDFVTAEERAADPFSVSRPVVFEPRHVSARIRAQDGVFTVHPWDSVRRCFPAFDRRGPHRECMLKLTIPQSCFTDIRQDLESLGVHAASMFPDLDGLARRITDQWL